MNAAKFCVWDIQTGVVINETTVRGTGEIRFSGNQRVVHRLDGGYYFYVYDVLKGTQLYEGHTSWWPDYQLGACWDHEDILLTATSFITSGRLVFDIQELQLTPNISHTVVESFCLSLSPRNFYFTQAKSILWLLYHGEPSFSFSPATFHASFSGRGIVIILDVRGLTTQLHSCGWGNGCFSPDGQFFACRTSRWEACVWKKTSTNYVPWSNLRARKPCGGFSFSPTSSSILAWGSQEIQLLCNNRPTPADADRSEYWYQDPLVVRSTDWVYIAMGQKLGHHITILDTHLGARKHYDVSGGILDMKVVDDTLVVLESPCRLVYHPLTPGSDNTRVADNDALSMDIHGKEGFVLSDDCSWIAFASHSQKVVLLYSVEAQAIIWKNEVTKVVHDLRFSCNQHTLWLHMDVGSSHTLNDYVEEWEMTKGQCVQHQTLANRRSWENIFSCGRHIEGCSRQWVVDPTGNKLFWLPPDWRARPQKKTKWGGDFLVLVNDFSPEPVMIHFLS